MFPIDTQNSATSIELLHFHLLVWVFSTSRLYQHHLLTLYFFSQSRVLFSFFFFVNAEKNKIFSFPLVVKSIFFISLQWCLFNGAQVLKLLRIFAFCFINHSQARFLTVPSLCVSLSNLKNQFPIHSNFLLCFYEKKFFLKVLPLIIKIFIN